MDSLERLASLFEKFPGIGSRQAERFVQFLLRAAPSLRRELSDAVQNLSSSVRRCSECMRFFAGERDKKICDICSDASRDASMLAIVAHNADLLALERARTYRGYYFVIGGTISLASDKHNLHTKELIDSLLKRIEKGLNEIILALPANPEGDATAAILRESLANFQDVRISMLGRGLSTGSELEYADPETIKNALAGRK